MIKVITKQDFSSETLKLEGNVLVFRICFFERVHLKVNVKKIFFYDCLGDIYLENSLVESIAFLKSNVTIKNIYKLEKLSLSNSKINIETTADKLFQYSIYFWKIKVDKGSTLTLSSVICYCEHLFLTNHSLLLMDNLTSYIHKKGKICQLDVKNLVSITSEIKNKKIKDEEYSYFILNDEIMFV